MEMFEHQYGLVLKIILGLVIIAIIVGFIMSNSGLYNKFFSYTTNFFRLFS